MDFGRLGETIAGLPARRCATHGIASRQEVGGQVAAPEHRRAALCDEPVSALEVSIQAQIVNLLEDLQRDFPLTYLFIAPDLAVVRHISTRIIVRCLGKIVEIAPADDLYEYPLHLYTITLLSAIPIPDPKVERNRPGDPGRRGLPSPANPRNSCRFDTRCPYAQPTRCADEEPRLREPSGHVVACHCAEAIKAGEIQLVERPAAVPAA